MRRFPALEGLPPYVFAEINRLKAAAAAAGQDILDLGMGNPDLQPPRVVLEALSEAVEREDAHRYSDSRGILELRQAKARYYERRFGVKLDPETEIIATLGSKEGFATLARTITAPGDTALVPAPCYPIHAFAFIMASGAVTGLPAHPGDELLRAAEEAIRMAPRKPIAMVLNYPSNPLTVTADIEFYREAVAFAKKHDILLLSDLAYSEIYFGDTPPPSIFEVEGAKDIAVEFTSMSKTFSMAGWRLGFAAGAPHVIGAMAKVKSYLDYGGFEPMQHAAIRALDHSESAGADVRARYESRRDALIAGFADAGVDVPAPDATMFVWMPLPEDFEGGSVAFAEHALKTVGVAVSPGVGFGPSGEDHMRLALIADEDRLREAAGRLAGLYPAAAKPRIVSNG
ncbi:aminotransferase class I/II-fold pyridoxal phosphate-dependent enzyme [Parvularcula sp. ZS-1/3]|uniref:Aminotransferase n=1 Tax=Parvularcula mediterranea TaxID=2732508 RepID=A0A7Y3W4J9_9PROT|nr:aminotransferase class I/II-fold pyridoxal phosphate-dependent enzyme [Parvularcula mediterranea]NNU15609.1 aminotransferase class I/II-fold pyridoxal phosphate-dependent enzyme [Parvularcula mediterranea]